MTKRAQPSLIIEKGSQGRVGVLRDLHQIQLAVPDKHFFVAKYRSKKKSDEKREGSGLFARFTQAGAKKIPKIDIEKATEKVKAFHNSFQQRKKSGDSRDPADYGAMSVSAMNDFRVEVKSAAAGKESSARWRALEAIINYIDLKNSGIIQEKAQIQQDCLRKTGEALHEDGGLSMFHATWYLTMYKDYLSGFRMFRPGEVERISRDGGKEAEAILKKLQRRQLEIPVYLALVDDKAADVKMLLKYSKDPHVKKSRHGQKGVTRQDIRQLFQEIVKDGGSIGSNSRINEVNIVMSYAMLFARIPMLYEVVEFIKSAIPGNSSKAKLYRQKIAIAQKVTLLDIARATHPSESGDAANKLYQLASSVYNYCGEVISENRLLSGRPRASVETYPIMKQAALLITYRKIFQQQSDAYLEKLGTAVKQLETVKGCSQSGDPTLIRIAGYADAYIQKLQTFQYEKRISNPQHTGGHPKKKTAHP